MKIYPECAFANEERFPACLWCNALLVHVESSPAPDPRHPEHARRRLDRDRHRRRVNQLRWVAGGYVVLITLLAVLPGGIFRPVPLVGFAATAAVVIVATVRAWIGPLAAMFVQGAFSTAVLLTLGLGGVFTGCMLLGHIVLPAVFGVWLELVDSGHG